MGTLGRGGSPFNGLGLFDHRDKDGQARKYYAVNGGKYKRFRGMYVCMYDHTDSKSMDQPGKVANPARGQVNRENEYFPIRVRA